MTYRKYFLTGHLAGLWVEYVSTVIPPSGFYRDAVTNDWVITITL